MTLRGLLTCAVLALGLRGADAATWPQPALGESKMRDVELLFTFDDGPNLATTPLVLDILAQHKIRAVFFLVGEMVEGKEKDAAAIRALLDRMVDEGHVLANHTMTHQDLCKVDDAVAVQELDGGRAALEAASRMKLAWFRTPFGVRCDRLDAMLAERHLAHFHWDLDPQEWRHGNIKRTIKYVTTELARASGRNVLLMHDIKLVTVKALPVILAWLDEENAKRTQLRKRKIRVLQAPDVAVEFLRPEVKSWLADASSELRGMPNAIANLLP